MTNGRSIVGQEAVAALKAAGASIVFRRRRRTVEAVPRRGGAARAGGRRDRAARYRLTRSRLPISAADIGGKVDILVNTTEHARAGGLLDRQGTSVVRDEIDQGYLGSCIWHRRSGRRCGCAAPMASTARLPGSISCRSMRWRTGRCSVRTRRRRPPAYRCRTPCGPSSAPAASRW